MNKGMFTNIFPIPRYDSGSDEHLTRYFEILHTIGMTIHSMVMEIDSLDFEETYLHLQVPHANSYTLPMATNTITYRRLLQTSEKMLPANHNIWPWEKVVLRACSFTLLLCMVENYQHTAEMLDSVFSDEDEWTYFAGKRHIKTLVESLPKFHIYELLRKTCATMPGHVHPQTWIRANLANWVEVCGKNISSFLQLNVLPGGSFEDSQRYVCLVASGEQTRRYVGSIHILTKRMSQAYLLMGILKHPMTERTCNHIEQYAGFVRTTLDGVQRFMASENKSVMWTYPLARMMVILCSLYGDDDLTKRELVHRFLTEIGICHSDRHLIMSHPVGIFINVHVPTE